MSAQPDVVDGEVTDVVAIAPVAPNLLAAPTGAALVEVAAERATALAGVIKDKKLTTRIGKKDHVSVEGWTLCGSMMGVFPVTDYCNELRDSDGKLLGFEARVEARTLAGAVVGAAISRCMRSESTWSDRDEYALSSMAQTRATSKALRQPLGWVMLLAGYEAGPAEEQPGMDPEWEKAGKEIRAAIEAGDIALADIATELKLLDIARWKDASAEELRAALASAKKTKADEKAPF